MPEIYANIRVKRSVRETLVQIQKDITNNGKKPTLPVAINRGSVIVTQRNPIDLWGRMPGLPDLVETAVQEFREKYRL